MAERDDEREVARRYRALGQEAPPPELDAAIRSKAHAVLAKRRNWYLPMAAAAALVLAVAVTVQLERGQQDPMMASAPTADVPSGMREMRKEAERFSQEAPTMAARAAETPEQSLERIAKLRREGRHEEADRALIEFRKRYPGFRIPAEVLEKVERK
jgi:negative regulator of sigma E activity